MSKKDYDAAFCGNLPLAYVNTIQPDGYLLVVSKDNLELIQASENCNTLFGRSLDQLLSTKLDELVESDLSMLRDNRVPTSFKIPISLKLSGQNSGATELIALVQNAASYFVVELFNSALSKQYFVPFYQQIKYAFAEIEQFVTIESFSEAAVNKIKELSGFDSVLMYQFDEDWNGKVIGECNDLGKPVYLGQQFPASDIPKQARALYSKNAYRLISDVDYVPVKIFPTLNPLTLSFLDLSGCQLRGVAPVHIQYLKNMDVKASMSIRIMVNNQLWGLFALHHTSPHLVDYETCCSLELLSDFISRHISGILEKTKFDFRHRVNEQYMAIQHRVYNGMELTKSLFAEDVPNVLSLFRAGGAYLSLRRRKYQLGNIPTIEHVENLLLWLHGKHEEKVFATDHLSTELDEAKDYAHKGSGLLAIELDRKKDDYLLIFRPETEYTIDWGGNPNEAIVFNGDNETYNPRHSFAEWKEQVTGTSRPWEKEEVSYAQKIRYFILEYLDREI